MSIFSRFLKKNVDIKKIVVDNQSYIPKVIHEIEFHSDHIEDIIVDNFIDTSDPLNIAKYKSNLKVLERQILETKKYDKMFIIRNDDFLPPEWIWRVNSADTAIEKVCLNISYELRRAIAASKYKSKNNIDFDYDFAFPVSRENIYKELSCIDKTLGNVYLPVRFRSTKHFTVNTPLGYTGDYNQVDSNRTFTIIDNIDNFINNGYAYSINYRDAYLDVTHKGLEISKNAVILIDKDKFESLKSNKVLFEQLKERRIITYKGDINLAINMFLTEQGVLPYKAGQVSVRYQDEVYEIMDNSFRSLAQSLNIYYDKGHGNTDGRGGHFSDLYDGINQEFNQYKDRFAKYLNEKFNLDDPFNNVTIDKEFFLYRFIDKYGIENILAAISEFNEIIKSEYLILYKEYVEDRNTMTDSDDKLFQDTLLLIKNYHENQSLYYSNMNNKYYIESTICQFFHSNKVNEQREAAMKLNTLLALDKNNEYNK